MKDAAITRVREIRTVLQTLCEYYADRQGQPHPLNETQIAVYVEGLARFTHEATALAAKKHMQVSAFFPRLSDLLGFLQPRADFEALAHQAWATLEREARAIGAYRNARFVDPCFGRTVRQVFGSWAKVCSIDVTSPEWAIRRQTFLKVFVLEAQKDHIDEEIVLGGLHRNSETAVVGHLDGLPVPALGLNAPDRSKAVLAEVIHRFEVRQGGQRECGARETHDERQAAHDAPRRQEVES